MESGAEGKESARYDKGHVRMSSFIVRSALLECIVLFPLPASHFPLPASRFPRA